MKTDLGYANVWKYREVVSGGSVTGCSQTGYINGFDVPMNFIYVPSKPVRTPIKKT